MKRLSLLVIALTLVTSCVTQKKFKNFPKLDPSKQAVVVVPKQETITLSVHPYCAQESLNQFGIDFRAHGYLPLQMQLKNNSCKSYTIRPSYLELPLVSSKKIAKLMHWDTSTFVWSTGTLALLFWWPGTFLVAQNGYEMHKANKKITKQIKECSLECEQQELRIAPYETFNRYLFVYESQFDPHFQLKIYCEDDKELVVFDVDLTA